MPKNNRAKAGSFTTPTRCPLTQNSAPHTRQVDARDAFPRSHIGKQLAHRSQPALRLGVTERTHTPHFIDRAAGNGRAFEFAQVLQLQGKRKTACKRCGENHGCPQTGVIHLESPNPQTHRRSRHHAAQLVTSGREKAAFGLLTVVLCARTSLARAPNNSAKPSTCTPHGCRRGARMVWIKWPMDIRPVWPR